MKATPPPCSIDGCDKPRDTRDWCRMHYTRWQRHGDPLYVTPRPKNPRPECKVDGCSRPAHGYGMCVMHHKRWMKYGDPERGARVVRSDGPCSVTGCSKPVKSNDLCGWHYEKSRRYGDPLAPPRQRQAKRYRMVSAPGHPLAGGGRLILLHRKVLFDRIGPGWHHCYWCGEMVEWRAGRPTKGALVVDHLDHDFQNNAPENLVPSCNPCNGHRRKGMSWEPWRPGSPVIRDGSRGASHCAGLARAAGIPTEVYTA